MEACPVVEIRNLSFTYGCHPVLKDISLSIMAGEVVGITGPNGAGKTTLLKLLVGQLQPQSGEIKIYGINASNGGWRRRVSYIPQRAVYFNQAFPATVWEVVLSGRAGRKGLFRSYGAADFNVVGEALRTMEIYTVKDAPISSLSGGQQQRALIARSLAAEPELLIMDEPTVGVDAAATERLYSILKEINAGKNLTLIVVSHDQEGIAGIITRQVCLNLHLCTCNSWRVSPGTAPAGSCGGLAGRIGDRSRANGCKA
jgi:zinc transport system ATP-binding protein